METEKLRHPFGPADHQNPDYAATITSSIKNSLTIIEPAILTGALTLNLDISPEVREGDRLIVKIKATATETTTFGTGIDAPALVGVAGKTKTQLFMYVGGLFIAISAPVQID